VSAPAQTVAFEPEKHSVVSGTQFFSTLDNHIEHRPDVRRGAGNLTQYLARCRFPFSAFGKFSLTGFKLLAYAL
jgi:hypothetical protein